MPFEQHNRSATAIVLVAGTYLLTGCLANSDDTVNGEPAEQSFADSNATGLAYRIVEGVPTVDVADAVAVTPGVPVYAVASNSVLITPSGTGTSNVQIPSAPVAAAALPEPEPEPEAVPEPPPTPTPEPEAVPPVAEAAPEPEPVAELQPEPEPEATVEPEPEPVAEPEPEAAPEPQRVAEASFEAESTASASDVNAAQYVVVGDGPGEASCLELPQGKREQGSLTTNDWKDWIDGVRFSNGAQFLSLPGESEGNPSLRHAFIPSSIGTDRGIMGANLSEARTYRLVESIKLEDGWDYGGDHEGGKIGFGFSGGASPSGGKVDPKGFSVRTMFRGNFDGTGRLVIYSYAADRPSYVGEDYEIGDFVIPIGEWFDVAMEVTTNSSTSASDGSVRVWVNGELELDKSGIAWQTGGGQPLIDNLYYSNFYGGGNPGWSPDRTTYARFRDVCWAPVVNGYSGIDPDAGRVRVPEFGNDGALFDDGGTLQNGSESGDTDTSTIVIGRLEAVGVEIANVLDDQEALATPALVRAGELVASARDEGFWLSTQAVDPDAPPVFDLDKAAEALQESAWTRLASGQTPGLERSLIEELDLVSLELVDLLADQLDTAIEVYDCASSKTQACRLALYHRDQLAQARDVASALSGTEGGAREAGRQAWLAGVAGLRALSS